MNPLMLEMLPWIRQGYCCSQILILLTQELLGKDCSSAVSAARGLCFGLSDGSGACGLLTGGACALALLADARGQTDDAHIRPMLQDYALWFEQEAAPQGIRCQDITGIPAGGRGDLTTCGELVSLCWGKIVSLADDYAQDTL